MGACRSILVAGIMGISVAAATGDASADYLFIPPGANFIVLNRGGGDMILRRDHPALRSMDGEMASIASGRRVRSAADDPAALAVAVKMEALMRSLEREAVNAEDMRNYLRFVDSVLEQNTELLRRIRLLVQQSGGVFMGPDEREFGQSEIDQLLRQIDMNSRLTGAYPPDTVNFLTAGGLGVAGISIVKSPKAAMTLVDRAMARIQYLRSTAGVRGNILTFQIEGKSLQAVHLTGTISGMTGADIGEAVTDLIRSATLLQFRYGMILRGPVLEK
ncbi:MAG: hypothetical protein JXA20_06260 [Spirochaetes bacterium]|nr:hypothetical protein [Spirochaetota bacterium]